MTPLLSLIKPLKTWEYAPQTASKDKKQKYIGLVNQGATCYMNSMNQQLFMIPAYRYNLLTVDDNRPEQLAEYKGRQVDDNVLH